MRRLSPILLLGVTLMVGGVAFAEGGGTREEAKAMATRAAAYLKANGPEKALAEFSAKDSVWHDRDMYVTVLDGKGVMVAHGTNPGLVGRSMLDLKDVDGKAFNRDLLAVTDTAWISFKWQNPVSKAVETKTTYDVRVGDYVVSVGVYSK